MKKLNEKFEEMEDFYITLPSNVKNEYYENTVANFKTKLATNLKLEGNWMVGISSFSYTKSWTVSSEEATFEITYYDTIYSGILSDNEKFKIDLSESDKVEDVIDQLNTIIEKYETENKTFKLPRFQLNKLLNRVQINCTFLRNGIIIPRMSHNLCKVLGINKSILDKYIERKHETYKDEFWAYFTGDLNMYPLWRLKEPIPYDYFYIADNPYNILLPYNSLYVYCDLIKHNYVGDSFTQLMRIVEVPADSKFRDQILINYSNIHYMPLIQNEFDSIEIDIRDDLGINIPFLFGRTIVSLHFKKQ